MNTFFKRKKYFYKAACARTRAFPFRTYSFTLSLSLSLSLSPFLINKLKNIFYIILISHIAI